MTARVCLHRNLVNVKHIEKIAIGLALFLDTGKYPDFLGHCGQFENNPQAMASNISKIHIVLYSQDWSLKSWQNRKGYNRTSDNFVIYANHYFYSDYYQILGIATPKAHSRIDSLLPDYIDKAEQFHSLKLAQLEELKTFTNTHEIANSIKLTA